MSSRAFVNSERICRFLRISVERALAGETDKLKEYAIGRDVFDRGEKYDPRIDSIVRVEARRLRSKLQSTTTRREPGTLSGLSSSREVTFPHSEKRNHARYPDKSNRRPPRRSWIRAR